MSKVVCVASAKVPIVKVWDPELELACDMNVNNTLAIENTRMIKTYVQIDERVRPLTMIIKYWTKQRILNDAGMFHVSIYFLAANIRSNGWYVELIHVDLYGLKFPTDQEPTSVAFFTPDAIREASDRNWGRFQFL